MNILCLDQFGELGGAQRCLLDLLPAMADRGWSVHLAAPGDGQLAERGRRVGSHRGPHPVRAVFLRRENAGGYGAFRG